MKKITLSAILFLGIATVGFSQTKPDRSQKTTDHVKGVQHTPEERAQRMTDALEKKLSLTANQKAQVYQINLERAQAISSFKGDKKRSDFPQMKAQLEASEARILNILTDSQKATYNELKAERQARMRDHNEGRRKESQK